MPRSPRIEFDGAFYHVMARGDRREAIYLGEDDQKLFLKTIEEACERTGALIHAYALMGNHYHLALETPAAALVDTMKWLQATYTQRFNGKHKRWGHVFGGRYKAILIQFNEGSYFRHLIDYIHLNPVRAGLVNRSDGFDSYPWTSLTQYKLSPGKRYPWMQTSRGFECFQLKDRPQGRREFLERLESKVDWENARAAGKVEIEGQSLQSTLRRGWYFGSQAFKEGLLKRLGNTSQSYNQSERHDLIRHQAETLLAAGLKAVELRPEDLAALKKSDFRKAFIAHQIVTRTPTKLAWIAERLHMGKPSTVSRVVKEYRDNPSLYRKLHAEHLRKMSRFVT